MGRTRVVVGALGAVWTMGCSTPPPVGADAGCPDASVQPLPRAPVVCPACDENARCVGGICACNTGHAGDGEVCSAVPRGSPRETVLDGDLITVSADGNVVAITDIDHAGHASIRVMRRGATGTWADPEFVRLVTDGDIAFDHPSRVALSSTGDVLVIGAPVFPQYRDNSECGASQGRVFIHEWRSTHYEPTAVMRDSLTFGWIVEISEEGNTVVVGDSDGLVRAFERTGTEWEMQWMLRDSRAENLQLSADGDVLAVKRYAEGDSVFSRSGDTWVENRLDDDESLNLALSADGNRLAISSFDVTVYARTATGWQPESTARVPSSLGAGDVVWSADGQRLIVSARAGGVIFTFVLSGETWTEQERLGQETQWSFFGNRLALSADGNTLAATNATLSEPSHVHLFEWSPR